MQTTSSKDLPPLCPSSCPHSFHTSCWRTLTLLGKHMHAHAHSHKAWFSFANNYSSLIRHARGVALWIAMFCWLLHHFGLNWNISTTIKLIAMKAKSWFPGDESYWFLLIPWLFLLRHHEIGICGFWVKYLNNYWMDCHKVLRRPWGSPRNEL